MPTIACCGSPTGLAPRRRGLARKDGHGASPIRSSDTRRRSRAGPAVGETPPLEDLRPCGGRDLAPAVCSHGAADPSGTEPKPELAAKVVDGLYLEPANAIVLSI